MRRRGKPLIAVLCAALLAGCGTLDRVFSSDGPAAGQAGFVRGFLGGVAAEEPRAALAARETLSAGGNAVDAAVTAGFMLGVTLPSRASLAGGGVCLAFDPRRNETISIEFLPGNPGTVLPGADRPAALPGTPRGLFALHARLGRLPFSRVLAPAEQAARFGTPVSRALAADLAAVWAPLSADPQIRAVFGAPGGTAPLRDGDQLVQPELANLIGLIRGQGVGEFYQGGLARRFVDATVAAGGGITVEALRGTLPRAAAAVPVPLGLDLIQVAPVGGSAGAAVMLRELRARRPEAEAEQAALAAAAAVRAGTPPATVLAGTLPAGGALPPLLGATTGFVVVDREGQAVACAMTMNNLFGTGRMAPTFGTILAAAPGIGAVPPALPTLVMVTNPNLRAFRLAGAASGGEAAPVALGAAAARALAGEQAAAALAAPRRLRGLEEGTSRVSLISCARYLPGSPGDCSWAADPRGAGLALGAD